MSIDIALLAAGYGTRLRPISDALPKPLVHVGHQPLLTSTLVSLRQTFRGTGSIGVNAHHRAEKILEWGAAEKVLVATEDPIRGTAGGVKGITDRLGSQGDLLVVNGDIYGFKAWKDLADAHEGLRFNVELAKQGELPRFELKAKRLQDLRPQY